MQTKRSALAAYIHRTAVLSSQRWSKADSLGFCEEDKDTKVEQAEEAKEVKGGKRCTALI